MKINILSVALSCLALTGGALAAGGNIPNVSETPDLGSAKKNKSAISPAPALIVTPRPGPGKPGGTTVIPPGTTSIDPHPNVSLVPVRITGITVSSNYVEVGHPLIVKVNGVGANPQWCPTSILIDQLAPNQKNDYGDPPSNFKSGGWPRSDTFVINEEGIYQVRLLPGTGTSQCFVSYPVPGDLVKITVGPAIPK